MKLQTLALAALVAFAGQSFAQTTTPAQTPPSKEQIRANKDQVQKDKDALKAAEASGDQAQIKAAKDKLKADRMKAKADRQARNDSKAPAAGSTKKGKDDDED